MSDNVKKEEKWTLFFRDDQCQFISDAMKYIADRADERIGNETFSPFDRFSAEGAKLRAQEITQQIADVTS